jgi:hypothetical protein
MKRVRDRLSSLDADHKDAPDNADDSQAGRLKRISSVGRFLHRVRSKLHPTGQNRPPKATAGPSTSSFPQPPSNRMFASYHPSQTDLSLSTATTQLTLSEDVLGGTLSSAASALNGKPSVNLATFTCCLHYYYHDAPTTSSSPAGRHYLPVNGRLYLTDVFVLFVSRSVAATIKVRLDWHDVVGLKLDDQQGAVVIAGLSERYTMGEFSEAPLGRIFEQMQAAWHASCFPSLAPKAQQEQSLAAEPTKDDFVGPRWPCRCSEHYGHIVQQGRLAGTPQELFEGHYAPHLTLASALPQSDLTADSTKAAEGKDASIAKACKCGEQIYREDQQRGFASKSIVTVYTCDFVQVVGAIRYSRLEEKEPRNRWRLCLTRMDVEDTFVSLTSNRPEPALFDPAVMDNRRPRVRQERMTVGGLARELWTWKLQPWMDLILQRPIILVLLMWLYLLGAFLRHHLSSLKSPSPFEDLRPSRADGQLLDEQLRRGIQRSRRRLEQLLDDLVVLE